MKSKNHKRGYTIHFDPKPKKPYQANADQERMNAARRKVERRRERDALRREIDWWTE